MKYRTHRYRTSYPASLSAGGREMRVSIVNVSEEGARLSGAIGVSRGDAVTLITPFCKAPAVVKWVSGSALGLAFRPQLPIGVTDALRYGRSSRHGAQLRGFGLREL